MKIAWSAVAGLLLTAFTWAYSEGLLWAADSRVIELEAGTNCRWCIQDCLSDCDHCGEDECRERCENRGRCRGRSD